MKIVYNANGKEEVVALEDLESSTLFSSGAPNKNKTNPRENLEFVFSFQASREGSLWSFGLFFVRDYSGLSVKFRIIKGEIFSRLLLYATLADGLSVPSAIIYSKSRSI